jgi:hypothetical protein
MVRGAHVHMSVVVRDACNEPPEVRQHHTLWILRSIRRDGSGSGVARHVIWISQL